MSSALSALADTPEAGGGRSQQSTLVSVLIPLEDHRHQAERSLRAWCANQTLDRARYEVIVVAARHVPARTIARMRRLLGERDRLVITASSHDVGQVAEAAALARGELLFFSESHVWPEPDVLERCLERMDQRADWSALICRLNRVTLNRLGDVEADMYERDFGSGATELRWRNINDAGFCTRRAAYFAVGGFDPALGHFAEWVLAARYATAGFAVGNCPDIVMSHLYPGDIRMLRHFTEDFTKGEITYLARGPADRREMLIEAPLEWSRRGERRGDLARHIVRMIVAETARALSGRRRAAVDWRLALARLTVAAFGGRLARVTAALQVLFAHAALVAATCFRSKPALAAAFERYIAAIIRRTRLSWIDAVLARRRPAESGELWSAYPDKAADAAGLHEPEEFDGVPFCWSETVAAVAIELRPGRYRIHINTLLVQLADDVAQPQFYVNGEPLPADEIAADDNTFSFCVDIAHARGSWLGWICAPARAPDDERRLGLPLVSILATLA